MIAEYCMRSDRHASGFKMPLGRVLVVIIPLLESIACNEFRFTLAHEFDKTVDTGIKFVNRYPTGRNSCLLKSCYLRYI